jgi:hypothetical protein
MTIERPMFPPARANIIDFQAASERRVSSLRTKLVVPPEIPSSSEEIFPETASQRAGQKRNPVRRLYSRTGLAVTIAGKLHRGEALLIGPRLDDREWLRRGAEAARLLADELARLVEQEG